MDNQNSQNISRDSQTNWKFILILVILSSIIVGGIFAYQYQLKLKEIPSIKPPETERVWSSKIKTLEVPFWEFKEISEEEVIEE